MTDNSNAIDKTPDTLRGIATHLRKDGFILFADFLDRTAAKIEPGNEQSAAGSRERPVVIDNETWLVRLTGDEMEIYDQHGRRRHRSKGHMMTGVFLTMAIAGMKDNPPITIDLTKMIWAEER